MDVSHIVFILFAVQKDLGELLKMPTIHVGVMQNKQQKKLY